MLSSLFLLLSSALLRSASVSISNDLSLSLPRSFSLLSRLSCLSSSDCLASFSFSSCSLGKGWLFPGRYGIMEIIQSFQSTLLVRGATAESTKNIRNQYLFCTNTGFSLIFFNVFGREKHHFISFFIANFMFTWHSLRISYHHKASKFPLLHNVLFWTCNCFPDYIF